MKIFFFKPFVELAGTEQMDLNISCPVSVRRFLGILAEKVPSFRPYLRMQGDEVLSFFVILVRKGEILKMDDLLQENDEIKILPPISGG